MKPVYALWDRDRVDADGRELLRWLIAAQAAGREVVIVDRAGVDLETADLDGDAAALRDAVLDAGARVVTTAPGTLPPEIDAGDESPTLHRLAPRRRETPDVAS